MIPTVTPVPKSADCRRRGDESGRGGTLLTSCPTDTFEAVDCLASLDARDAALAWEQARYWRNFGLGTLIGALIWAASQCLFR